jgi:hypothetical protein
MKRHFRYEKFAQRGYKEKSINKNVMMKSRDDQTISRSSKAPARILRTLTPHDRPEQTILTPRGKGIPLVLALLLLEQLLRGINVNALASISDLKRPLDIVLVEAQLIDHARDGTVNRVLNLWTESWGREDWLEGWTAGDGEV